MRGVLYLVLCGVFLGTVGIWVKLIGPSVSPLLLTAMRAFLSAALIIGFVAMSRKMTFGTIMTTGKNFLLLSITGLFGVAVGFGFFIKSFHYVPVSNAVVLVYIYPVMTTVMSYFILKERVTRMEIIALLAVVAGVWSIYLPEAGMHSNATGNALALVAGAGYSVFFVAMRHFERKGMPYWETVFWPLVTGGIILTFLLPSEPLAFEMSGPVPLCILGLGFFSFLGYLFYAHGLEAIQAHKGVIIVSLTEPLTAIVLAAIILGEGIPQHVMMGGALIIAANLIVGKEMGRKADA